MPQPPWKYLQSWIIGLCALLLLPSVAQAQVIGKGYNNSLIYKIQSPTNTVYILGSLHALAEEYYPLTRAFMYSYYNSQKIIFEIDPKILFSRKLDPVLEKASMLKGTMTLQQVLTPRTYRRLTKKLWEMGIDPREVQQYKPWKMYLLVGSTLDSAKGFRPDLGIERYFYQKAIDAGKTTGGLETPKDQLAIFDKLSFKEQEALLLEVLGDHASQEQRFSQMVKHWHQGNLEGMEAFVESFKTFPKFYQNIMVKRNKNWVPQIEAFLKDTENYFVIVGVAHLAGEDGLLALLTEKGYAVERVSFARP